LFSRNSIKISITFLFLAGFLAGLFSFFLGLRLFDDKRINVSPADFGKMGTDEQDRLIKKWSGEGVDFLEIYNLVADLYPSGHPEKHVLAHTLGEIAIRQYGLEGFGSCDSLLSYGCYHGAALTAARVYGYDLSLGKKLWSACKERARLPGDCLHGLGHAVMVIEHYDLLRAYDGCESIFENEDESVVKSFWCKDGVSMENVERSLSEKGIPPYGKEDDLYYPCNAIPERHRPVCFRDHVSYLKNQLFLSKKQVADFCLSLPKESADLCFDMTGSLVDRANPAEDLRSFCPTGEYEKVCVIGAVSALSMEKLYDEAEEACLLLSGAEATECNNRIRSIVGENSVSKGGR